MNGSDKIYAIVCHWIASGILSLMDWETLKSGYLDSIGNPKTCTVCESFRSDVRHYWRYQFKTLNYPAFMSSRKYNTANGDNISIPAYPRIIINEGMDNDSVQVTNDDIRDAIVAFDASYAVLWEENPDYVAPEPSPSRKSKAAPEVSPTDPTQNNAPTA